MIFCTEIDKNPKVHVESIMIMNNQSHLEEEEQIRSNHSTLSQFMVQA
jgi:hypothetical protein